MSTTKPASIIETVIRIAKRVSQNDRATADQLLRVAQYMGGGGGSNFDPSQESGGPNYNMHVVQNSHGGGGNGGGMHPGIESFVQPMSNDGAPPVDDRKTHTLTCTLKAPEGVSEADMMNYILKIGAELGVDVDSFKWSKSDPKPSAGAMR